MARRENDLIKGFANFCHKNTQIKGDVLYYVVQQENGGTSLIREGVNEILISERLRKAFSPEWSRVKGRLSLEINEGIKTFRHNGGSMLQGQIEAVLNYFAEKRGSPENAITELYENLEALKIEDKSPLPPTGDAGARGEVLNFTKSKSPSGELKLKVVFSKPEDAQKYLAGHPENVRKSHKDSVRRTLCLTGSALVEFAETIKSDKRFTDKIMLDQDIQLAMGGQRGANF